MSWRMLQDDAWPDDVIPVMDRLADSLRMGRGGSITTTAMDGEDRLISFYSVCLVGEVTVGISGYTGEGSNFLWAVQI